MIVYRLIFPSGKSYIGVATDVQKRFRVHSRSTSAVGAAIRKYGAKTVKVETLMVGHPEYCYEMERLLIQVFNTLAPNGYNLVGGGLGGGEVSDVTRAKMSEAARQRWSDPAGRERMVRIHNSPETKARHSKASSESWRPDRGAVLAEVRSRPEVLEKNRKSSLAQWADPDGRAKLLRGIRRSKGIT